MDLADRGAIVDDLMKKLVDAGDEVTVKQIKSSKAKFEQALQSRSIGRSFQGAQREFYEKLFLVEFGLKSKQ
jgi:hypothetical protein